MIELGPWEWFLIAIDVICLLGFAWAIWFAKKIGYPNTKKEGAIVGSLIAVYTILLLLYLFGVIND